MIIRLSPQWSTRPFLVEKDGDAIIVDGDRYDFGPLLEGDVLPLEAVSGAEKWLVSDVVRENGHITFTMVLPHGSNAPGTTLFPEPITVAQNGPVVMPLFDVEMEEAIADVPPLPEPPAPELEDEE